jgi:glutathione S-transferase
VTTHKVDIYKHIITETGADFFKINPKGNVPCLVLADGTVLNEGAATLQWIADQAPASGLAPAWGTTQRYALINSLNYLASELHASYGPLFNPAITEEAKAAAHAKLATKLQYVNDSIPQVKAETVDIASLYLYIIQSWSGYVKVDLTPYAAINAFAARIAAHPTVVAAHKEMNEAK